MISRTSKIPASHPRVEICEALGFKSPNAAEEHLKALEKKGNFYGVGASRSIKLLNNFDHQKILISPY